MSTRRGSNLERAGTDARRWVGRVLACLLIGAGLLLGCSPEREPRLAEIRSLQAAGEVDRAISALETLLAENPKGDTESDGSVDPEYAEAHFMLGRALLSTKRPARAIDSLEKAATDPRFARSAGLLIASTLFEMRVYAKAAEAASRVLELDPMNPIALLTRGRSRLSIGRPAEALADAQKLLEIDPESQNGTLLLGGALIDLGRRDEAEKVWINLHTRMTTLGNTDQAARACGQLALFYRTQKEQESADRTYEKCLEHYPTHAYLLRWATDFYIRNGASDRAIEIQRRAVDTAPGDLRLWAGLADLLLGSGAEEDARKTLERTVELFDSSESWRLLADFHLRTGDALAARKALEEAIQRSQEPDQASLFRLADLLIEEGNIAGARAIAATLNEPVYQHLLEGMIQLRANDARSALESIDIALANWPQNPHARFLAGEAALALGDRSRAGTEYLKAIESDERATDAALRLAELEFNAGRYRSAWSFAQRQIVGRPYSGVTPYRIAIRSALELEGLDVANEVLERLRSVDPDGMSWVVEAAEIKRHEGGAKAASEFVLGEHRDLTDPANELLLQGLAEDLQQLGRAREGLDFVDAAIARSGTRPALHGLRARVLAHLDRFEEAEESVQRALQLNPDFAPALEIRAYLALERGDRKSALAALDAAAAAAPQSAEYCYAAASIARESDDEALTIRYLEEALLREPTHGPAANDLARLLATRKVDLDRALALAQTAVRRSSGANGATALDTLGWVRHQRGEYEAAVSTFRAALERDPARPAVQYRLGLALAATGETLEARALFQKLLKGPSFPEIDAARAELARLDGP